MTTERSGMSEIAKRRRAAAATADTNAAYTERVTLIRQAASRVFHERGFHATKLSDVADAAGLDRSSLYYYVGSKQQLFRDVVSEAVTANIASAEGILNEPTPAVEKLTSLIIDLMRSFERHFPFMYVLVKEDVKKLTSESNGAAKNDAEWLSTLRDWNERYFTVVRQIIREGIADGSLKSTLPAGVVANCMIGMVTSSGAWFTPGGPLDAEEVGAGMAQLFLSGLKSGAE
jgi:AcrR family transcriptional regulator